MAKTSTWHSSQAYTYIYDMSWVDSRRVNQTAIKWRTFKCLWRVCDHLKCRQKLNRAFNVKYAYYIHTYICTCICIKWKLCSSTDILVHVAIIYIRRSNYTHCLKEEMKKTEKSYVKNHLARHWNILIHIYVYICASFTLSLYLKIIEHNFFCRWMKKFTSPSTFFSLWNCMLCGGFWWIPWPRN